MANYQNIGPSTTVAIGENQVNDRLDRIVITPLSKTPGKVYIKDGSNTKWEIYSGLGNLLSLTNIRAISIALDINSKNGGWTIETESDVQAIVVGEF